MKSDIKIFDLKDPKQYEEERNFWSQASIASKLGALEAIREFYFKLFSINKNEARKRLRRIYRITEQKRG